MVTPFDDARGGAEFTALKLLWQGARAQAILNGEDCYPSQVDLSLTTNCNLRCRWCVDGTLRREAPGTWETGRLLEVLAEYRRLGVGALVLDGGGEPTAHPDFDRVVSYAADLGLHLGLVTNGLLLTEHADLLTHFDWIRVSLDAPDAGLYRAYKGVDGFDQALAGIGTAVAAYGPVVGVGYLTAQEAVRPDRLQAITATVREMGADYFQVRRLSGCADLDAGDVDLSFLESEARDSFAVHFHQVHDYSVTGNDGVPCLAHRLVSVVSASGEVFFCRRLQTEQADFAGAIGNLYAQGVEQIWHGEQRRALSVHAADGDWCLRHCPSCRLSKYNLALHQLLAVRATSAFL